MYPTPWMNNINRSDIIPPTTVSRKVKNSDKWKRAMLDSFEHVALIQFKENLKFWDYYRMVEGKMSYQELKEAVPQMESLQAVLDGVGVPTFLKHYDLIGKIVRALVGKLQDVQDKFNIIDVGEVAQNEILRYKNQQFWQQLQGIIDNEVSIALAEAGMTEDGSNFNSPEEQQAFMQKLQEAKEAFTPKDVENSKRFSYKTAGLRWAEATKEKDIETMDIPRFAKEEFKDKQLTGRCFREYIIAHDNYYIRRWHPITTFISKETDNVYAQDGEYVGNIDWPTPAEVIRQDGAYITTEKQKELLGGNESWQNFVGDGVFSGTVEEAIDSNFSRIARVPFSGFSDYNFYLGLQDELGLPLGDTTLFKKDGTQQSYDSYLPRYENRNGGTYNGYASIIRNDFYHRRDLCQRTKVYFRAYDLWGYLTYEDPESGRVVTEEVTEDILKDFLKENNIKATFKTTIEDVVTSFEVNTLKWIYRPVTYEAVKIQSGNLSEPLYLYCRPMEHQIKGDTDFDVKLPVAGYIGEALAPKIMPYQSNHNLVMNQIQNLIEKELGVFFLMDIGMLPSEIDGWGDAEETLITFRNIAKDVGIFPVKSVNAEGQPVSPFNQFSTQNLSASAQIATRIQLADVYERKAYEVVGFNPQMFMQATKYETAEGIKISNEANFTQISDIFEEFSLHEKRAWEIHLSVAQYCQSNKKDLTVHYTKSDGSIMYLQITDPDFPLRRFGLLPSKDPKKKKELEEFKNFVFQTNTLKNDLVDFARLRTSDTMLEAIEIFAKAKEDALAQEKQAFERQQMLIQQENEGRLQIEKEKQDREDKRASESNITKVEVAKVTAFGRAADKQSDSKSFDRIENAASDSQRELVEDTKLQIHKDKLESQRDISSKRLELDWAKIRQKDREIDVREKISQNQITNSTINKN